jgi:ABC-2 type transport system ATP-binding protein
MDALVVDRVSKQFSKPSLLRRKAVEPTQALRDVSLSVREGEVVGLLGPNGAGKTTLLKVIATLIYPTSGHVRLFGADIHEHPTRTRRQMGLVTCDERSFYWRLTARQNLSFFGTLYGVPPRELQERSEELLETLGLTPAADRPYQSYSSGMKQKLAIARGLLADPRVVFYDEPTRSLDPLSAQNIRNWVREKRKRSPGQTHVIATNQLTEAEQLCDRVFILNRGSIIADGPMRGIREKYNAQDSEVYRIAYRGATLNGALGPAPAAGLYDARETEPGVLRIRIRPGSAALSAVLDTVLRAGAIVERCELEQSSLDEIFCSLVLEHQPSRTAGRDAVVEESDASRLGVL